MCMAQQEQFTENGMIFILLCVCVVVVVVFFSVGALRKKKIGTSLRIQVLFIRVIRCANKTAAS